jgi:ribosomal protein S1
VHEDLDRLFPGHRSPERAGAWEAAKARLQLGATVRGVVVARYPFGVFVDIDTGFPALILVVKLKDADQHPYTDIEQYPAVGSVAEGRIYVFGDVLRQIGLTQLEREPMLGEA